MHNWTKIDLLQPWRCNTPSMVDHLITGIIAMAFCARQHLGCRSHIFTLFRLASPFGHGQQPLHRDFFYPRKNRIGKLIYTGFKNTKMNIVITICRLIGSIAFKWVISILSCIVIPPQVLCRLRRDSHIPRNARSTWSVHAGARIFVFYFPLSSSGTSRIPLPI